MAGSKRKTRANSKAEALRKAGNEDSADDEVVNKGGTVGKEDDTGVDDTGGSRMMIDDVEGSTGDMARPTSVEASNKGGSDNEIDDVNVNDATKKARIEEPLTEGPTDSQVEVSNTSKDGQGTVQIDSDEECATSKNEGDDGDHDTAMTAVGDGTNKDLVESEMVEHVNNNRGTEASTGISGE